MTYSTLHYALALHHKYRSKMHARHRTVQEMLCYKKAHTGGSYFCTVIAVALRNEIITETRNDANIITLRSNHTAASIIMQQSFHWI